MGFAQNSDIYVQMLFLLHNPFLPTIMYLNQFCQTFKICSQSCKSTYLKLKKKNKYRIFFYHNCFQVHIQDRSTQLCILCFEITFENKRTSKLTLLIVYLPCFDSSAVGSSYEINSAYMNVFYLNIISRFP